MNEVQFISDLAFNMVNGLSDYRSAGLDAFYKAFDKDFPHGDELSKRMELVFAKIAGLRPAAIRDTIFFRIPLFFTLFLILDSVRAQIPNDILEDALFAIDKAFNSDTPLSERNEADAQFYLACTASTQRIKSRGIRDQYVRMFLQLPK